MILLSLILILFAAGIAAAFSARWNDRWPRWICLAGLLADLVLVAVARGSNLQGVWLQELDAMWIAPLGIRFHLALDGLSWPLLLLTCFIGLISVLCSWTEIRHNVGFFHLNLMWILAGIIGVFLAVDLFVFYLFWELMLIPMYFLIAIWGHERRVYAAIKFFLFTQLSGLLMLVAIIGLVMLHRQSTGVYTFDYRELMGTSMTPLTAFWLMAGFLVAFVVKLPMIPFHTWLPDAHTEAPTAGSVILAGLLLKTGAYGLFRFVLPLFPGPVDQVAPFAMALGVAGILYGAVLAFGQTDLKRLVAYTSVSHMGFVLLGIFAGTEAALQGVLLTMVCHALSTGGLFILVGALQERLHTRSLEKLEGLWSKAPVLSGTALFLTMASMGLPGLGDFVGEFLVLAGTFQSSPVFSAAAAGGMIAATLYGLRMLQRAFYGAAAENISLSDLSMRERMIASLLVVGLVWLGLSPQPVIDSFTPVSSTLLAEMKVTHE